MPFGMYLLQATNWRVTWAAMGLLALAVPMAFFFLRNDPAELGLRPDGDPEPPEDSPAAVLARRRGAFEVERWTHSFRTPPIWQLSAAYTVCGITTGIISFHLVPYAIGEGISPLLAATIFGVMMGLNSLGSIGASVLSDRFRRKNVLAAVCFLRGIGYVLLLVLPPHHRAVGVRRLRRILLDRQPAGEQRLDRRYLWPASPEGYHRGIFPMSPDWRLPQHLAGGGPVRHDRLLQPALRPG